MSWKKFGSPYDPNYEGYGGKRQQNPEQRRQEQQRNEDQFQVRGCGDPWCDICNYHIPNEVRRTMGRGPSENFRGFPTIRDSDVEFISLSDYVRGAGAFTMVRETARESGPPESYKKARKAVEQWLKTSPDQAFDDIVGNEDSLGQLRDAIRAPVEFKKLYEAYGMKMPKGALLSGPPGCGKTMFARAAASEMKKLYGKKNKTPEFLLISGTEIMSPWVGVTEGHIKAIFDFGKEYKAYHKHPLLVFIDEADVLFPDRTARVRKVAPWEESQVAAFLAEMDGIQESGVFVMLATNRPGVMDQAVLRDGRCDFKIVVKRPTPEALKVILHKNFEKCKLLSDPVESLVDTAVECFQDPFKVLVEFHAMGFAADLEAQKIELKHHEQKHFLLEHIVSGAMAASVPSRSIRYAFMRDKETNEPTGVQVADVVNAVRDIYEENKTLDHSFAFEEFKNEFMAEVMEKHKPKGDKSKLN